MVHHHGLTIWKEYSPRARILSCLKHLCSWIVAQCSSCNLRFCLACSVLVNFLILLHDVKKWKFASLLHTNPSNRAVTWLLQNPCEVLAICERFASMTTIAIFLWNSKGICWCCVQEALNSTQFSLWCLLELFLYVQFLASNTPVWQNSCLFNFHLVLHLNTLLSHIALDFTKCARTRSFQE